MRHIHRAEPGYGLLMVFYLIEVMAVLLAVEDAGGRAAGGRDIADIVDLTTIGFASFANMEIVSSRICRVKNSWAISKSWVFVCSRA